MKSKIYTYIFASILIIAIVGLTGCSSEKGTADNTITTPQSSFASSDIKKFNSVDDMKNFLENISTATTDSSGRGAVTYNTKSVSAGAAPSAAPESMNTNSLLAGSASDYSQTNVQVKGVDEADFVKNDDRYIYMIADNKLVIIDGFDAKNSKIISTTNIDTNSNSNYYGNPNVRDLFLNNNKVIVFVDKYEPSLYFDKYNIQPIETSRQNTVAYIYDVSDRINPKLVEQFTVTGSYYDSRMIGDIVYVITQEGLYNWQYYDGPMVSYAKTVIRPSIYYFDNPEQNYQMNTITSIDISKDSVVDSKSLMLGYGNALMVSENNIYIAYQKQQMWCWGWRCAQQNTDNKERFMTVVVPLLEGDIKDKVQTILDKKLSDDEEWTQISQELSTFYTGLKNDTELQDRYQTMFGKIQDALNEYDAKKAIENSKTVIHRISIKNGAIEYQSKGEVDGRLLNQFSMDESNNNLRVATTVDLWLNNGRVEYNNVYVLDDGMNVIGSLTNLASNESIYISRFMGDKLYIVTFKQVDPFFVIDLSEPTAPKVLGYLKIPGYSSYLHPISDNLILGVGKETGENQYGGITTKGVKVSLFDVSDFNNPKEVGKYEIGLEGTDSPVLYDHRAFLYSATKNIIVVPVTEIVSKIQSGPYNYRTNIWNGAYVFKINNDTDNKIEVVGKVKHSTSENDYYYWSNDATVMRSLYMDDSLYTISSKTIKVSDLNNSLIELNTIGLPYTDSNVPTPVMYATGSGGSAGIAVK